MTHHVLEQLGISLLFVSACAVHMTPAWLAHVHRHPQKSLIVLTNLIPGVGWFVALALLASSSLRLRHRAAELQIEVDRA